MKKLRTAVLLDSEYADPYVGSFCVWIKQQCTLDIVTTLVDCSAKDRTPLSNQKRISCPISQRRNYKLQFIIFVEKLILKSVGRYRNIQQNFQLLHNHPVDFYCHSPQRCERSRQLSSSSLAALEIDLFIIFGSPLHKNEILSSARLGAVTLDYDCGTIGSLAPPGFWETYYELPVTRFHIRFHPASGEQPVPVFQGSFATKFSFLLNQSHLLGKSIAQLKQFLLNISSDQNRLGPLRLECTAEKSLSLPSTYQVPRYLSKLAGRVAVKTLRRAFRIRQKWGLSVFRCSWRDAKAGYGKKILAPSGLFWADPFLLVRAGKTYCFVEEYQFSSKRGRISVIEFAGEKTIRHGVALEEDFHLSFPFLFEYNGELYMCPESSECRQVRIYKCKQFPLEWELISVPFDNFSMADSLLFPKDDKWWLISSVDRAGLGDHCSELNLYFADSPLEKKWTPHPKNPICVDATAGRNAGLILEENRVFRAAQRQGFDQYGEGLSVFEIVSLSENDYAEVAVKSFEAPYPDQADGYHHISTTGEFTVIDRLVRSFSI